MFMPLDIIVCIKQVPHPDYFSMISLDPTLHTITREGIPSVINPLDKNALEEALRIRDRYSGRITAVTMGPSLAKDALEEALAMGIDKAILLSDIAFAGADTLATAYCLAYCIKKIGRFDLILCGNSTIDSGTGQVGPQLAELLNVSHINSVRQIILEQENSLIVVQVLENGYMKLRIKLPALLSVTKGINVPRLPTVQGILEARNKEILIWNATDVQADSNTIGTAGSRTHVTGILQNETKRRSEIFSGKPEDAVKKALARLYELNAI